ncbi:MAG: alginate O-acetyltransferase complex protein AlgJ [Solirubrobacteraceae bacterium]|nr:alginate O-acetyltransferase complex protein AlgJ [Solirubrobacteraceae bacterium]
MQAANSPDTGLTPDDVRAIYRELLERDALAGEVQAQMATCRTAGELVHVVHASEEYEMRLRARGKAALVERPRVNVWHPDLAGWTHPPGTVSEDGTAIVGHEGWLFILSGSNSTLVQHRGENAPPQAWLEAWMRGLAVRRRQAAELGIALSCLIVPDKLAIQEEHFPEPIEPAGPRPALRLRERAGDALLYPVDELRAARARGAVALRADTHLTVHGNHVLAQAVMRQLGLRAPDLADLDALEAHLSSGDLGSRFTPPIVEVGIAIPGLGGAEVVSDNRDAIAAVEGHVGTIRVLRNASAPDRRVAVLLGDSYGFPSPYYQGLGWWLAQVFAELHFVWVPFGWDPGYLRDVGAGVAVVQTAERFVGRVPLDRVDARELARLTIETGRPAGLEEFTRSV